MNRRLWTREELILAFNLYFKLPFGQFHKDNPEVKKLASIINRTNNSVAIRLGNFASCDPYLKVRGIRGMEGGLKQCKPIWDEFINDKERLIFESEQILANFQNKCIEEKFNLSNENLNKISGNDKLTNIKTRINQSVFRQIILSNYGNKCAISQIDIPEILVASHIIPWARCIEERLNPTNGICLSPLYDKTFDCGLISVTTDFKIIFSNKLKSNIEKIYYDRFFAPFENKELILPTRYYPNPVFLKWHLENIFQKN